MTDPTAARFAEALRERKHHRWVLRLYVAGATPTSIRAIRNLHELCERHLSGRYHTEVIDIYQRPALAESEQIVAVPTLIRDLPLPIARIVGDLSDHTRVLVGLDLVPRDD